MAVPRGETLGEEVRRLRLAAGMTQKDLHERCGLSQPYIAQIETGKRKAITADALFALARAFGVSTEDFGRYFPSPAPAEAPAKGRGKKK